ncbi:MAG: S41 family peptidase [Bacillota bacterium]
MRLKKHFLFSVLLALLVAFGTWSPASAQGSPGAGALSEVLDMIEQHYLKSVDRSVLIEEAIQGMLDAIDDKYADYLPPEVFEDLLEDLEGSFVGIGVTIELRDAQVRVMSVFDGGPASRAGIEPGSLILEVDGQPLTGMSLNEAARLIRGDAGSTVSLKILPEGQQEAIVVEIVRELIALPTVEWRMLEEGAGYVKVRSFKESTPSDVYKALDALDKQGMRAVVLDLRNNPGGLLSESAEVAEAFLSKGPLFRLVRRDGQSRSLSSRGTRPPMPTAVLVNGGTASGAEIVAGAIQDRGTGYLVGTRTYGKGMIQTLMTLETGGGLRLTTAEYFLPSGRSIEGKGLEPNYVVERGIGTVPRARLEVLRGPDLGVGAKGDEVRVLQEILAQMGHDPGPADGVFGPRTRQAVLGLQGTMGVQGTGILDEATREALLKTLEGQASHDPQLDKALEILRHFLN